MKANQKGFSIVEVLVVLVIVGLLSVIGWLVYDRQKTKTSNPTTHTSSSSSQAKTATVPDPYAGWKTYTSINEKITFKYPSDWIVKSGAPDGNVRELITLVGPNNFNLDYTLLRYDPSFTISVAKDQANAGGSPDPTKVNAYNVIDTFTPMNYSQPLYVVSTSSDVGEPGGPVNNIELSAYKNYASQPLGYPGYYISKNDAGYIVQWFGGYHKPAPSSGPVGMPTATFLVKDEVKTATLILKSVSY